MHNTRLRPSPAVKASISPDGLVLLDVAGGLVLASNNVGARIWQLIEEDRALPAIARQVVEDYGIDEERARRDVGTFVNDLIARGLLAVEPRA